MGKPSSPQTPNPMDTANAQSKFDINTAVANSLLNRTNQVTPYGDLTYTQNGTVDVGGNQVPTWTATQTLTPDEQAAVQSQQALTKGLYGLGNNQLGRISDTLAKPLDYNGLPQLTPGLDTSGLTAMKTSLGPLTAQATSLDTNDLPSLISGLDNTQFATQPTRLNTGQLSAMPSDPTQMNQQVSNAIYNQASSRLDPQWAQQQSTLQNQLVNEGIPQNSDAWNKAMAEFNKEKTDAYNTASNTAITSGAEIGGADYGLALQGRQQGVTEQSTSADIANQANQAALQRQQAAAALASGARGQMTQEQLASAGLANTANQTAIQAGMDNASLAQASHQQQVQDQLTNAQLAQSARDQGITERTALYNQPLNEATALMSGGQVGSPNFVNVPQVQMQTPDFLGAQSLRTQSQLAVYQQKMQAAQSKKQGMGGAAGTVGAAALL